MADETESDDDTNTESSEADEASSTEDAGKDTLDGGGGTDSGGTDNTGANAESGFASNVIPIDVFEPLGRYQSYLKVLSSCVTELADEAAASIGGYLRRPVSLRMGDIRVIGQANCQPENSLLNGERDFFIADPLDGHFYVGLSNDLVANLVELFYGGSVETLSAAAGSPGCVSETRMRKEIGKFFTTALFVQLKGANGGGSSPSSLAAISEQELIKRQFSHSMLSVMLTLESDGLKCELETGFCIKLLENWLGVSFSSSEPVAISDARWSNELRKTVADCDLELRCTMAELPVRLGDVQKFKVGDFIPLADLDSVIFSINRRKLFQGQFGVVDEKPSASFKRWV